MRGGAMYNHDGTVVLVLRCGCAIGSFGVPHVSTRRAALPGGPQLGAGRLRSLVRSATRRPGTLGATRAPLGVRAAWWWLALLKCVRRGDTKIEIWASEEAEFWEMHPRYLNR